jgi:hypothetical protein
VTALLQDVGFWLVLALLALCVAGGFGMFDGRREVRRASGPANRRNEMTTTTNQTTNTTQGGTQWVAEYTQAVEAATAAELYASVAAIRKLDARYGVTGRGERYSRRLRELAVSAPEHVELVARALRDDTVAVDECLRLIAARVSS